MEWDVIFHWEFEAEYAELPIEVRRQFVAALDLVRGMGPLLSRPHTDTLSGSRYANMKELRFFADDGVWRVAYAFDPKRRAAILVAGDKSGVSQKRFYKSLINKADERFTDHLAHLD
jgi:hypothetical protein